MKYSFIFLFLIACKTFAQSTTLLPNATKIGNVASLGTCNSAARGTQVFNTTDGKMYFCNGAGWVDMTGGGGGSGFTLPYSGSGATSGNLFTLTNTGSGRGISVTTGLGRAIFGESDGNAGIYGVSNTGVGVFGYANSNFSGFFNNKAKVGFNLAVGQLTYEETIARLHIKADGNGGWGQHIRMENGTDTGYGEILHDTDGMKFRNFQASESFIFRNSLNNTIASLSSNGTFYLEGPAVISSGATIAGTVNVNNNLYVEGVASISGKLTADGQGIVQNPTASTYIIRHETEGYSFSNLAAGASIISTLGYPDFSGVPAVSVAQVENGTGGWDKVLVTPYNVTAASCSVRLTNVSNSAIDVSGTWHFTVIGPK
ncbi:hypothetical protein [Emticicia sp. C21]|uniref:hypothetical protein n=1 Tax=Emticicia sp. C21 TaxID=2302915 RepID=UPI000E3484EB|nr:hypothetical protein [Emticicia sp. C21]RFS13560.1 hypothetical protein D0T08_25795 [Emticicia sp. C21]